MRTVETLKKNTRRILTLQDIVAEGLLPWARNARTVSKLLERDIKGENLLQADVSGKGRQRRYLVKAGNIIKYLEKYGPVLMHTVRKTKAYGSRK